MTNNGSSARDWMTPQQWFEQATPEQRWMVWEQRYAEAVLDRVRARRKELKLTAQHLSERLSAAGWPLSVNSINGMLGRKGRQSMSFPQIIALAAALELNPIDLALPASDEGFPYFPDRDVDQLEARAHFTGESHRTQEDDERDLRSAMESMNAQLRRYEDLSARLKALEEGRGDGTAANSAE